jgi:hypothetical protein
MLARKMQRGELGGTPDGEREERGVQEQNLANGVIAFCFIVTSPNHK